MSINKTTIYIPKFVQVNRKMRVYRGNQNKKPTFQCIGPFSKSERQLIIRGSRVRVNEGVPQLT